MAKPRLSPRDAAVKILKTLRQDGYTAYLAGGCVRDELLGYHPKDYDIATDAKPDQVRALFKRTRYVGEAFGVVQVRMGKHTVEVATFRAEWGYEDGRRPTKVQFTDAQHDAQRRDFTINGLFEDPLAKDKDQQIIDYVGGRADLEARLVRAIGDPQERFSEDYLRMLRAVRFATRLRFEIEPATAAAIAPLADRLTKISRERIGQEVMWMLTPDPGILDAQHRPEEICRPARAIRLIQQLRLDSPVLNEDHAQPKLATVTGLERIVLAHAPRVINIPSERGQISDGAGYGLFLAAWLLDRRVFDGQIVGPAGGHGEDDDAIAPLASTVERFISEDLVDEVARWRGALCLSNEQRNALIGMLRLLPQALAWGALRVAKRKRVLAHALWPAAAALLEAVCHHQPVLTGLVEQVAKDCPPLWAQGVAPEPWVSGDDLVAMGREPGPAFSRLLEEAYDAQLEGMITSRAQALTWLEKQV